MKSTLLTVALVYGTVAAGEAIPGKRPVTDFGERELNHSEESCLRKLGGMDDDELFKFFDEHPRKHHMRQAKMFEYGLKGAVRKWKLDGDEGARKLAIRVCKAALRTYLNENDEKLRSRISEKGSIDLQNHRLRDACEHFALLYYLSGDSSCAHKAAVLLARFGEVTPKWPCYQPYGADPDQVRESHPQSGPNFYRQWDASGFWGTWIYLDLHQGVPLARAYDLIYNSGEMQKLGALRSIERMLYRHIEIQRQMEPKSLGNLDGYQMRGFMHFARLLNEPEWVHECVHWIQAIFKTKFYADGWWHEGTVSYHRQTWGNLVPIARDLMQGYSDPPGFVSEIDGTRFGNLDILKLLERPIARAQNVDALIHQPDGNYQTIHDTSYPQVDWQKVFIKEARPVLFGCMGHGTLGTGKGENMVQASLHFGGTHGHEHYDCLNLTYFAKGKELISETLYRPIKGSRSTYAWQRSTAAHNTVVVDERSQTGRGNRHTIRRHKQPEDAVEGIADWRYRWAGAGDAMNDGKLRLFNTEFEWVQVVEADGERSIGTLTDMEHYRRTIVLVKISESDTYVVDIFRVKGGRTHDYLLHSCLSDPYGMKTSLDLRRAFGLLHSGLPLEAVHAAATDNAWRVDFTLDDGSAALASYFLPQPGTRVTECLAPAMRRIGRAPFLAVSQSDGDSTFVVVHHPYRGQPAIRKVELLKLEPASEKAVAIRVSLPERVDTIISTMDEKPWPIRQAPGEKLKVRGRFAHIAQGSGADNWAYLVDGDLLELGDRRLGGKVSHCGVLTGTLRVEAGDDLDAFVTPAKLPGADALAGRTLMVDQGGLLVQSFRIDRVEQRDGRTLVHSRDEPGMTIKSGLVKLEYYPCWGIRGEARFKIAGSALLRAGAEGEWQLKATGPLRALVGGREVVE